MQFTLKVMFLAFMASAPVFGSWFDLMKANEYRSADCTGDLNFRHRATELHLVSMDKTTHSVYINVAGQPSPHWGRFRLALGCTNPECRYGPDMPMIVLFEGCNNLDNNTSGERIVAVQF